MTDGFRLRLLMEVLTLLPDGLGRIYNGYILIGGNNFNPSVRFWITADQFRMRKIVNPGVGFNPIIDYRKVLLSEPDALDKAVGILLEWCDLQPSRTDT